MLTSGQAVPRKCHSFPLVIQGVWTLHPRGYDRHTAVTTNGTSLPLEVARVRCHIHGDRICLGSTASTTVSTML